MRAPGKATGLYHTPPRTCNFPQVTHFKQFSTPARLTVSETGTYTHSMSARRLFTAICLLVGVCFADSRVAAQAIQRSLYVSVVNDAGGYVPDLGPRDFIVRED